MPWAKAKNGERGLTFLASASPSAASTISFNNVFTSSYRNYRVLFNLKVGTNAPDLIFRFRASGSDNSTSNYSFGLIRMDTGSGSIGSIYNGNIASSGRVGAVDSKNSGGWFDIYSPAVSEFSVVTGTSYLSFDSGIINPYPYFYGTGFSATTTFDGFSIYPGASSLTGFVSVYGYIE